MATSYSVPVEAFLKRIEEDKKFFRYFELTPEQAMDLAIKRSKNYLMESISKLMLKCHTDIDFSNYDDVAEEFEEDWTNTEVFLVSSLMYEMYMERDIVKLKSYDVNFTPTELRVFDPSNARETFLKMYKLVCDKNELLIDDYESRDRLTGKIKSVKYSEYDE